MMYGKGIFGYELERYLEDCQRRLKLIERLRPVAIYPGLTTGGVGRKVTP